MIMRVAIVLAALIVVSQGLVTSSAFAADNDLNADEDSECRDYHSIGNSSEICEFVKTADDCQMDEGFVNYITFVLCETKSSLLPAVYVLYILWLLFLFVALGTTAENFFCPALEFIAQNLKLSQNIAGITVVAFGNGAPDIFSALAAFVNATPGSTGVAVGALLGAGMFVTTVVAGAVSITGQIEVAQRPFLRDLTFYIFTVFWTFCLLYNGKIDIFNSLGFLLLYAVYVIVVLVGRYVNQRLRKRSTRSAQSYDEHSPLINDNKEPTNCEISTIVEEDDDDWIDQPLRVEDSTSKHLPDITHAVNDQGESESDDDSEVAMEEIETSEMIKAWSMVRPFSKRKWNKLSKAMKVLELTKMPILLLCTITVPVFIADPERKRNWSRLLTIVHCIVSPMFSVFATKAGTVKIGGKFPLWGLFLLIGIALALLVRFTSRKFERPKYYWVFAYLGFIVSIIWTYCIANEIVNLLRTFGALLNVSNVIMGLTLLAWGNSIGDMIADVTLARQGFPRMAISACFGGPLFNLIIGVGLPCTIAIIKTGKPILITFTLVEAVLTGGLLFSLCFSFIIVPLKKFKMTRAYGIVLLALYIVYLPIALLTGAGIIK